MTQTSTTGFGGAAGRVYRESFSFGAVLTGLVLGGAIFTVNRLFDGETSASIGGPIAQIVWALALVRFALNGAAGQWRGHVFSTAGGSWGDTGKVLLRYLALAAVWVIPMAILLSRSGSGDGDAMMMGLLDTRRITVMLLYGTATLLTPPVFLIAAAGADRFSDLISRAHWSRLFSGRIGDLVLIYALYLGAILGLVLISFPVVAALFLMSKGFALFVGGTAAVFTLGLAADLLGRLCGFFAAFDPALVEEAPAATKQVATAEATPETPGERAARESQFDAELKAAGRTHLALVSTPPQTPSGRPPLLDARNRVEEHVRHFDQNPRAAIDGLAHLHEEYAENPLVLHALCLLRARAGEEDAAVETARTAMPLFFQRGNYRLAAEVFHTLLNRASELELGRDALLEIAGQLMTLKLFDSAAAAGRTLIDRDAFDTKAIKMLMRLGEAHLHQTGHVDEAERIYRFLVERCEASPLAEYMRQGLEEAERKKAQG